MTDSGKIPFLSRRDRWGNGMAVWVIALVVVTLPPIFWSLGQIEIHNNVEGWLPRDDPQMQILDWYRKNFPTKDRVLLSWDDCSLTDPRLQMVAEKLEGRRTADGQREGGSPHISEVSLPDTLLKRMLARSIPFDTALQRVTGLLCGQGPLRIQLMEGTEFDEQLRTRIIAVASHKAGVDVRYIDAPLNEPVGEVDPEDTSAGQLNDELTLWVRRQQAFDLSISWPNMHANQTVQADVIAELQQLKDADSGAAIVQDAFVIPGSQAALTVTLSDVGIEDRKGMLESIQFACIDSGVSADSLRMGGRPVVTAELSNAVKKAAWNRAYEIHDFVRRSPILSSALISIGLSLLLLKSLRLAVMVQIAANLTVVSAVALVPVTGGSMNMVLVVMPTLLMVLTTSAAIHLSNYWKHAQSDGEHESVMEAASTAWLPCFLASCTTAIGLGSLFVSNLVPVRDFGVYSAIGCFISFFMVLYVMPSLMLYWRRRPPSAEQLDTRTWNMLGRWLTRLRYPITAACILATVACGYGLYRFRTETKVIRYFPPESRLYQDYVSLEDNLSGIISVDTIVRFNKESQYDRDTNPDGINFMDRARTVMKLQKEIHQHPEISGTLSLASFLDLRDIKDKSLGLSFAQRRRLRVAQQESEKRVKDKLGTGGPDAASISSMLALPDERTPGAWPDEPDLNAEGDELWRISAQAAILSEVDLEVLTAELREIATANLSGVKDKGVGYIVTGLIPVFLRTQQAVLESLIRSFGLAFVLIAIVMMVLLRSIRGGLITMLPNLMPVIIVFGLLSWGWLRVDIGTMITASVALGIAVDGTLHLITWFQELLKRGHTIPDAVTGALEHCGPAMWQTSAVIGLGMLALLPAELLLISRFGWMLAALIFAALVSDIIFLPALLAGPLGTLIQRSIQRRAPATPIADPVVDRA